MRGLTKQQSGRQAPRDTRVRSLAMFLALAASVVSFGTAHAGVSKVDLDYGFAHVKHGVLFICDTQGSNHSIASHINWARGQNSPRVEEAIRIQVSDARRCLARGGPGNKSNFEIGFGYLKQGTLILTEQTGPQHSIESHRNWAAGQGGPRISRASEQMLMQIEARSAGCADAVQGKIAWDYNGNTKWAPGNVSRLCRGSASMEPARCFDRVMHGGVNWGGGTRWQWSNAIDLCEGSTHAARTISCFTGRISGGGSWQNAIAACGAR